MDDPLVVCALILEFSYVNYFGYPLFPLMQKCVVLKIESVVMLLLLFEVHLTRFCVVSLMFKEWIKIS